MFWRRLVLMLAALLTVGVLAACGGGETSGSDQSGPTNEQTAPDEPVAPDQGAGGSENETAGAPEKKTLKLDVPGMAQIENSRVPSGKGSKENLFKNNAAVHLKGTDFPWESEAEDTNVYLAGPSPGISRDAEPPGVLGDRGATERGPGFPAGRQQHQVHLRSLQHRGGGAHGPVRAGTRGGQGHR